MVVVPRFISIVDIWIAPKSNPISNIDDNDDVQKGGKSTELCCIYWNIDLSLYLQQKFCCKCIKIRYQKKKKVTWRKRPSIQDLPGNSDTLTLKILFKHSTGRLVTQQMSDATKQSRSQSSFPMLQTSIYASSSLG